MSYFSSSISKAALLEQVRQLDVRAYSNTRNQIRGTVSRLSPYITRGVLSLPEIRNTVLEHYSEEDAAKFVQELAWREYWQQVWFVRGDDIFSDLRFTRDDWVHSELVGAIVRGDTGITAVDQAVEQLYEEGYVHNHARMWTAMMACNVAKAHWYNMSRWMYYHLLDGDLASNTLSWQWVAGTNAGKRYVAHQELINACSNTQQTATFLSIPRENVGVGAVPETLQIQEPFRYHMTYPATEQYDTTAASVYLYSPWTLDPDWRRGEEGGRILLLEPRWFDRFPVSPQVISFIVEVARTQVPDIKVVVANVEDIALTSNTKVFSRRYPATMHWPGLQDETPRLFPQVTGYFPSFFKFWKACTTEQK